MELLYFLLIGLIAGWLAGLLVKGGGFGIVGDTAMAMVNAEINRQAAMVAYIDDFWLMMWVTLAAVPLVLLLRPPKPGGPKASMADMGH